MKLDMTGSYFCWLVSRTARKTAITINNELQSHAPLILIHHGLAETLPIHRLKSNVFQ